MHNILSSFPDEQSLLRKFPETEILEVNAHIHTPYSFSAFADISQIFTMARREHIGIIGINDFFVTSGYDPFAKEAIGSGIFPLFNIEFIGLLKPEQEHIIRVNDPNNPGRCYFSGKGLDYPYELETRLKVRLEKVAGDSQVQIREMIDRANRWFDVIRADIRLDYDEIRRKYARELVRERHIAKAIRIAVFERYTTQNERMAAFTKISGGSVLKSSPEDHPSLENEIRGVLLKAGGKAFVEEEDNTFMNMDEVLEIIINAGGIPCYPVLLDDKNGNYTEYEKDPEQLHRKLSEMNIGCIELIPGRNDAGHLERFVLYFEARGFIILLGTEHNTPELIPLTCYTRGNKPLSEAMKRISYEGACVVAAHQYLRAKRQPAFISTRGKPRTAEKESFIRLGNAVVHHYIQLFKRDQ